LFKKLESDWNLSLKNSFVAVFLFRPLIQHWNNSRRQFNARTNANAIMSYVKESSLPGKDNYGYIFDQTVLVNATNYEKLFLKAMLEELTGRKQVAFFSKVFEKLIAMCQKEQIKCPSPNKAAQLCMALARTHVINLEQGPSALEWKISFNTPRDDVYFAVTGLKARVFR